MNRRGSKPKRSTLVPTASPVVIAELEDVADDRPGIPKVVESRVIESELPCMKNPDGVREFLLQNEWPPALQEALLQSVKKIPLRFFIIDDSGSMMREDGRAVEIEEGKRKVVECSRWTELSQSMHFHVDLAKKGRIPCEFRFLNTNQPIRINFNTSVSESEEDIATYRNLKERLDKEPCGMTPLCRHVREVIQSIRSYEHLLLQSRQKAMVIIATDGEASDGSLIEALRPLKDLPAGLLLRFCTNESKTLDYWNRIDRELELSMDVLDDYLSEAIQVTSLNPWLSYGDCLHRFREFGALNLAELDKLDESLLGLEEVLKLSALLYSVSIESFPHPQLHFRRFVMELQRLNQDQTASFRRVWNPITQKESSWIDPVLLQRLYHPTSCSLL